MARLLVVLFGLAVARCAVSDPVEVPTEPNAPLIEGCGSFPLSRCNPLTSVVVTQCNLIVAVYMTMPDGRLLRFTASAGLSSDKLMEMAYSATRSERVEVECSDVGIVGFEKRGAI